MPTIDLINVTKRWGDFYAVDNLNLHIDDYSFITLLGPSGCGKTTTLRMSAGLETPTSGKILINGAPVFDSELGINIPASKRHVGFLFQNYALWPHMTVQKNIEFGLQNLKEYLPVVDSTYTQAKDAIRVLKDPEKIVELINQNKDKSGKIDKRRALIALIDNFKISMFTAEKVFNYHFEEKNNAEIIETCKNEINELTNTLDDITKKYDEKGIDLNEDGYVMCEPEFAEDYITLKLTENSIRNCDKLIAAINKAKDEHLKPIQEIMSVTNVSVKTAKTLLDFVNSLNGKSDAEKKEFIADKLKDIDVQIRRLKSDYLNNGFTINEKGEKIPTIDFTNKNWDGKKVHLLSLRKLSKEEIDLKVRHVSRVVKIAEFMERYPSELSGGQQQRVAIARTLAPGPKVLVYVTHDQLEAMTLATKICLINNGVLQQYDAPLDVYKKPNNIFVADFVGNPAINFIEVLANQEKDNDISLKLFDNLNFKFVPTTEINLAKLKEERKEEETESKEKLEELKKNKRYVEKGNKDKTFNFTIQKVTETMSSSEEKNIKENEYILGIRPEFISLIDDGNVDGEIYSALPSGMETIVKIRVGEFLLTSVIFGGVDYRVGSKCKLKFISKEILLFDRISGKLLAQGSLKQ